MKEYELKIEKPSVSTNFQMKIMSKIMPLKHLRLISFALFTLFLSLISILYLGLDHKLERDFFVILTSTIAIIFSLFVILMGIYLINLRNPFLTEWKKKIDFIK